MLNDRFWSKVSVGSDSDCWEWTANKNNKGYGMFRPGGLAPKRLAHRLAFESANGPIPSGRVICHHCDNPGCVNPAHLFLGTMRDNYHDMAQKGRRRIVVNPNNKPPIRRGSEHSGAKLTEPLVALYRQQLADGKPLRQLARETGLDRKTLMNMRDRKSWRHVP